MLLYKKIDLIAQVVLMIHIALIFLTGFYFNPLLAVVMLGAAQLISVAVHIVLAPDLRKSKRRKIYYGMLVVAIVSFILIMAWPYKPYSYDVLLWLFVFLVYTLIMAFYYSSICWIELKALRKTN